MDNYLAQMVQPQAQRKMTSEELQAYIKKHGRFPPGQTPDQGTIDTIMRNLRDAWNGPKPYNHTMATRG